MLNRYVWTLLTASLVGSPATAAPSPKAAIEARIKREVAEIVAGINAKDADQATKYDAADLISMESGRPPSVGVKADREGLSMTFHQDWRLSLIEEAVDVSKAGDLAIYRSTYDEDSLHDGVPFTHTGNYVAGLRPDPDGVWRIHWSIISWQSPSHKK